MYNFIGSSITVAAGTYCFGFVRMKNTFILTLYKNNFIYVEWKILYEEFQDWEQFVWVFNYSLQVGTYIGTILSEQWFLALIFDPVK